MLGLTEMIADSLNPEFVTEIPTDYFFEKQQNMIVEVYDADDATCLNNLSKQEFIGKHSFVLASVVSARNQQVTAPLKEGKKSHQGTITIMVEELREDHGKQQAKFNLGVHLKKEHKNCFVIINKKKSAK
jgi:hypothetical protein